MKNLRRIAAGTVLGAAAFAGIAGGASAAETNPAAGQAASVTAAATVNAQVAKATVKVAKVNGWEGPLGITISGHIVIPDVNGWE